MRISNIASLYHGRNTSIGIAMYTQIFTNCSKKKVLQL